MAGNTIRLPQRGFGSKARSGGIRWSKGIDSMKHNMEGLVPATVEQVAENMKVVGAAMLRDARDRNYAKEPWVSHPERHRGGGAVENLSPSKGTRRTRGAGAHARWPSNLTAAEGMFVFVTARKTFVELGLAHDPRTIYIAKGGKRFPYGNVLETGFAGRFAVIKPTLLAYHDRAIRAATLALTLDSGKVRRTSPGGSGGIHSGWFKLAKDA
jgi:hypothetical protein